MYTYMVWVDDYGGGGSTLEESGAQLTITDDEKSEIVVMPPFDDKTPAGVQYWIVGCLAIVGETFKFVKLNKFVDEKPSVEMPKMCYDYFDDNPPKPAPTPAFCANKALEVWPFDVLTNAPVIGAIGDVRRVADEGGYELLGPLTTVGKDYGHLEIKIAKNGRYQITVEQKDYTDAEQAEMEVSCAIEDCKSCWPKVSVPFLQWTMPESVMALTWGDRPADLDLIIVEEPSASSSINCETGLCKTVTMVADSSGSNPATRGEAARLDIPDVSNL